MEVQNKKLKQFLESSADKLATLADRRPQIDTPLSSR